MSIRALDTILAALPGVDAAQVVFAPDGSSATISLRKDQLAVALRESGRFVREAAIATGVRLNVELAKSKDSVPTTEMPWWQFWRKKPVHSPVPTRGNGT